MKQRIERHRPGGPPQRLAAKGDGRLSGHKPAPLLVAPPRNIGLRRNKPRRGVLSLWQNELRFRMTLVGGFVRLVPRFGDADMAKKLSPEEAAVMIIRRRLQQVESAKKDSRRSDEPEKPRAAKALTSKPSRARR